MELQILHWFESLHNPFLNPIMYGITMLGEKGIFLILVALAALTVLPKKYRKVGLTMAFALIISLIMCNGVMKNAFARVRPFNVDTSFESLYNIFATIDDWSFPSGHTSAAFAAALAIFMWYKKEGGFAIVIAALIAISRLYLTVHYPTDVLVTGYDIIFFWVIRMVFSALEQTGKSPFKHVLIHGLVRDDQGRKMSKSLGNGIDPLEVIDKYGADALRLTLITGNAPGNDMRFYWERVENSRNFANKIWNASRFIMMNMEKADFSNVKLSDLTIADRWILSKVNDLAVEMTDNMEKYELGIAVSKVYDFIWEEFCDWYIEMVKPRLYNDADETKAAALWTLKTVLIRALKLLHPYMPFITEEIFCNIQDEEESIMISDWPVYKEEWSFKQDENAVDTIKAAVRAIRNLRTGMNVPPSKKATVYVVSAKSEIRDIFEASKNFFATLGYASEVFIQDSKNGIDENAVSTLIHDAALYIPLAELVDIDKEIERLEKESGRLAGEIKRASGMLANPKFVDKAPAAKVEEEKAKLAKYTEMKAQVEERLAQLKK